MPSKIAAAIQDSVVMHISGRRNLNDQLWVPLALAPLNEMRRPSRFTAVARLRAGVSLTAAQSRLDLSAGQLNTAKPDPPGWGVKLQALDAKRVNRGPRRALLVLLGAVGFVLLLACANAANLFAHRAGLPPLGRDQRAAGIDCAGLRFCGASAFLHGFQTRDRILPAQYREMFRAR